MKILVCGGRDYDDAAKLENVLNAFHESWGITEVIHGDAQGADTLAGVWARLHKIKETPCPAQWELYGKKAGYVRNKYMASLNPEHVIAFPGGKGTAMMITVAKERDIPVTVVE